MVTDPTGSPAAAVAVCALLAMAYLVPALAALGGSRAGLAGYLAGVAGRVVTARRTGGRGWRCEDQDGGRSGCDRAPPVPPTSLRARRRREEECRHREPERAARTSVQPAHTAPPTFTPEPTLRLPARTAFTGAVVAASWRPSAANASTASRSDPVSDASMTSRSTAFTCWTRPSG